MSLGFITLLRLLFQCCQLYLWGLSLFCVFFFSVASYISGVYHSSASFSVLPAISLGFITLLSLLFQCCQLYLWGLPLFCVFFCVASYISGVYHSSASSFSVLPVISLGFTTLLRLFLCCQLYLWGLSLFCVFF